MSDLIQLPLFGNQPTSPTGKVTIADPKFSERIRRVTHEGVEYFSLVDIMAEFSDLESRPVVLWRRTKKRLEEGGFQVSGQTGQFELYQSVIRLKLPAADGKMRLTDVADGATCLRIVQSIPSPKAEPIREWLASLGYREIVEAEDPEQLMERAIDQTAARYQRRGKDLDWVQFRLEAIVGRKQFTDALAAVIRDMPDNLFAAATERLYEGLWERTTRQLRGELGLLPSQNVRDHMGKYALHYTRLVEMLVADKLKAAESVTVRQAMEVVWEVARLIHEQAQQTAALLGRDLVTEKPLLGKGE